MKKKYYPSIVAVVEDVENCERDSKIGEVHSNSDTRDFVDRCSTFPGS